MLKELHANDYVHFVRHIQQVLKRNPFTILSRDKEAKIVGVVFCAFGNAASAEDLPSTMIRQSHWHLRSRLKKRNTMVDFWFTGKTGEIAEETLLATMDLAHQIRRLKIKNFTVDDDHIFAYSNLRTLWMHPEWTAEELVERITGVQFGPTSAIRNMGPSIILSEDPAISGHFSRPRRLADPVRIIYNAFPSIFRLPRAGIGRRVAVIMRYRFQPEPPAPVQNERRRFRRAPKAAAILLSISA